MALLLFLSNDTSVPIHSRLVTAITEAIATSRMQAGSILPSSRELAETLGISRATVTKAYAELVRSGHIVTRPSGKTHVADQMPASAPIVEEELGQRVLVPQTVDGDALVSTFAARLMDTHIVTNWGQAEAAAPRRHLPISQWKTTLSKYCNSLDAEVMSSHPFGEHRFRSAAAKLLARARGVHCEPEQIITFAESQSGLNQISQLLLNEGDLVIVEDPCFVNARNLFLAHGAEVLAIPVDEQGLQVESMIEKIPAGRKVKLIYVSPTFHDPTGVCMSLPRREKLLSFAAAHNSLIVEDTWDGSHSYVKDIPPPLHTMTRDANVFYLCSFWKILYPLSMVSCLVIPERFIPFFKRAKMISQEASPGIENTLEEFIETGVLEKHLKAVVRALTPARQKTIEKLLVTFGQGVRIRRQSSAYWLTVQFPASLTEEEIQAKGLEAGLTLSETSRFYADPESVSHNEFIVPFVDETAL